MSTLFFIITGLKVAVSLTAAWTILYWHFATKGTWRQWPAGRSLMALLTIICIGYAWRVVNRLTPDYPLEEPLLGVLYVCFSIALIKIARTIRRELATAKADAAAKAEDPAIGPVAIVVATTTEESTDGKH